MPSVLLTSFLLAQNYLYKNCYAFFRPEAILLWLTIFFCLSVALLLCRALKAEWLVYAFLLLLVADLATGILHHLYVLAKSAFGNKPAGYAVMAMAVAALVFVVYRARKNIGRFFVLGMAFACASAVLLEWITPAPLYVLSKSEVPMRASNGKPNLFFFVLDEHIGLAGIPREIRGLENMNRTISAFYEKNGFVVYEKTYSNYGNTLDSVPSLLNAKLYMRRRADLKKTILTRNKLFEKLQREGYRINIYQCAHPDYSRSAGLRYQSCLTYRSTATGYIQSLRVSTLKKLEVLLGHFVGSSNSQPLKVMLRFLRRGGRRFENVMTGALATDAVLAQVKKDLLSQKDGSVFFIHLLMPHSSYIYDAEGNIVDPGQWEESSGTDDDDASVGNTLSGRAEKYPFYFGQALCLHKKLAAFFDFMKENGFYGPASILMTADHGSRIFLTVPSEKTRRRLTAQDRVDAYSAFLVIKNGGYNAQLAVNEGRLETAQTPLIKAIDGFLGLLSEDELKDGALDKIYLQTDDASLFSEDRIPDLGQSHAV